MTRAITEALKAAMNLAHEEMPKSSFPFAREFSLTHNGMTFPCLYCLDSLIVLVPENNPFSTDPKKCITLPGWTHNAPMSFDRTLTKKVRLNEADFSVVILSRRTVDREHAQPVAMRRLGEHFTQRVNVDGSHTLRIAPAQSITMCQYKNDIEWEIGDKARYGSRYMVDTLGPIVSITRTAVHIDPGNGNRCVHVPFADFISHNTVTASNPKRKETTECPTSETGSVGPSKDS